MSYESTGKFQRIVIGPTISAPHTAPPEEMNIKKLTIKAPDKELDVSGSKSGGVRQYEVGLTDIAVDITADMHVGTLVYNTIDAGKTTPFRVRVWNYAPPGTDLSVVLPDWDFSLMKPYNKSQTGEVDGLVTFDFTLRMAYGSTYTGPSNV
jgi:hypothetical protein